MTMRRRRTRVSHRRGVAAAEAAAEAAWEAAAEVAEVPEVAAEAAAEAAPAGGDAEVPEAEIWAEVGREAVIARWAVRRRDGARSDSSMGMARRSQ